MVTAVIFMVIVYVVVFVAFACNHCVSVPVPGMVVVMVPSPSPTPSPSSRPPRPPGVLPARPAVQQQERLSELGAHGAVEDEVDAVVDESHHVHDVAQRHVHVAEEAGLDEAEDEEEALRQLRDEEEHDDRDEHLGGPGVLVELGGVLGGHLEEVLPLLDLGSHLVQQQRAEHGDEETRHELPRDGVHPHVSQHQGVRVVHAQAEVVQDVYRGVGHYYYCVDDAAVVAVDAAAVAIVTQQTSSSSSSGIQRILLLLELVAEVVGDHGDDGDDVGGQDEVPRLGDSAHAHGAGAGRRPDVEVADDGEQDAQVDGDGVDGDAEVDVDDEEVHPGLGVGVRGRPGARLSQDVEVEGEGDVTHHGDHILL